MFTDFRGGIMISCIVCYVAMPFVNLQKYTGTGSYVILWLHALVGHKHIAYTPGEPL